MKSYLQNVEFCKFSFIKQTPFNEINEMKLADWAILEVGFH